MKPIYTVVGIALGVIIGIPVGIGAYAYGYSAGAASKPSLQTDKNTICINGFVYEVVDAENDSPWDGSLIRMSEGQPPYIDAAGQENQRQSLPVKSKIVRG